ncbi:hypothetical protein J5N97_025135 [Dioscorea zingiberensis]|uniref:Secreted protein n=1 Tax=Dioscorea zingiberensis TaxID=325984 RepID=A0A9D5C8I5_9LILI|nr:hypothetical protein J5N97_025135 [Dioscorea zingiberensis]
MLKINLWIVVGDLLRLLAGGVPVLVAPNATPSHLTSPVPQPAIFFGDDEEPAPVEQEKGRNPKLTWSSRQPRDDQNFSPHQSHELSLTRGV